MRIERYTPALSSTPCGKRIGAVAVKFPTGEYVRMPDDGRPCHTDEFLGRMMEAGVPHQEMPEAILHWLEGAWSEAIEIVENYEALK